MRYRRAGAALRAGTLPFVPAVLAVLGVLGGVGPVACGWVAAAVADADPAATTVIAQTETAAPEQSPAAPPATVVARPPLGTRPLFMWTVQSANATVHLLGSVHVGTDDFYPLAETIEEAFAASDGLAVELDMTDPETVARSTSQFLAKAMYPADDSLAEHVDAETHRALAEYAEARGMPLVVLERMRPGAAAMYLVLDELQSNGYDPALGVDVYFLERARPEREVLALETVDQQIDALFAGDDVLDELLLVEALTQTTTLDSMMTAMVDAWKWGDAESMAKLIEQEMLEDERLRGFHERILVERNRRMLAAIERLLAGDQTWFAVVGAAHLVGETGLVAGLANAGYLVAQAYSEYGD